MINRSATMVIASNKDDKREEEANVRDGSPSCDGHTYGARKRWCTREGRKSFCDLHHRLSILHHQPINGWCTAWMTQMTTYFGDCMYNRYCQRHNFYDRNEVHHPIPSHLIQLPSVVPLLRYLAKCSHKKSGTKRGKGQLVS
jgi:hypothetical protein